MYNLLGDRVTILVDNCEYAAGCYHEVAWDGRDYRGNPAGSGIYIILMKTGETQKYAKIAVVK